MRERLSFAEKRISSVENTVQPLCKDIKKNAAHIASLMQKTDDFKNQLRRNNIRLIGMPE